MPVYITVIADGTASLADRLSHSPLREEIPAYARQIKQVAALQKLPPVDAIVAYRNHVPGLLEEMDDNTKKAALYLQAALTEKNSPVIVSRAKGEGRVDFDKIIAAIQKLQRERGKIEHVVVIANNSNNTDIHIATSWNTHTSRLFLDMNLQDIYTASANNWRSFLFDDAAAGNWRNILYPIDFYDNLAFQSGLPKVSIADIGEDKTLPRGEVLSILKPVIVRDAKDEAEDAVKMEESRVNIKNALSRDPNRSSLRAAKVFAMPKESKRAAAHTPPKKMERFVVSPPGITISERPPHETPIVIQRSADSPPIFGSTAPVAVVGRRLAVKIPKPIKAIQLASDFIYIFQNWPKVKEQPQFKEQPKKPKVPSRREQAMRRLRIRRELIERQFKIRKTPILLGPAPVRAIRLVSEIQKVRQEWMKRVELRILLESALGGHVNGSAANGSSSNGNGHGNLKVPSKKKKTKAVLRLQVPVATELLAAIVSTPNNIMPIDIRRLVEATGWELEHWPERIKQELTALNSIGKIDPAKDIPDRTYLNYACSRSDFTLHPEVVKAMQRLVIKYINESRIVDTQTPAPDLRQLANTMQDLAHVK